MAKSYKIKSHKHIYRRSPGSILLRWLLVLALLGLLFFLGWKLYEPLSQWQEEKTPPDEQVLPVEPAPQEPEPTPTPTPTPEPTPEPELTPEPEPTPEEPLRNSLQLSQETLLNQEARAAALAKAKAEGRDSVLLEVKNSQGLLLYPMEYQPGLDSLYTREESLSLAQLCQEVREAGLRPCALLYGLMDRQFQKAVPEAAILYGDSSYFWLDNSQEAGGKSWLNPYAQETKDYFCKLLEDCAQAGFEEVQFCQLRYPVGGYMEQMNFGDTVGLSKLEALKALEQLLAQKAEDLGLDLWVQLPALSLCGQNQLWYGGSAEELLTLPTVVDGRGVSGEQLDSALAVASGHLSPEELALLSTTETAVSEAKNTAFSRNVVAE